MNEEFEQKSGGLELPILILSIIIVVLLGFFLAFSIFMNSQRAEMESDMIGMYEIMNDKIPEMMEEENGGMKPIEPIMIAKKLLNFTDTLPLSLNLKYFEGYTVKKSSGVLKPIVITGTGNKVAKIEIYKSKDYKENPMGFGPKTTQKEADSLLAKDRLHIGYNENDSYVVRFFYSDGDTTTRDELREIADSIVIK
ncbi:MAG: hypothetical protein L3J07_02815 [Candidatus Magasanikbacteria bacterium]|nr:hypothetical protein [Candidatus Magasanikbacteria bacterium]